MTPLTAEQKAILNEELDSDPNGKGYAVLLADRPGNVVELLNARTETAIKSRLISARGILSGYPGGPMAAAAVLDKLDTAASSIPALKWAWKFISGEGIDIGSPATQGMLDVLTTAPAGSVLTTEEAGNLKSLALLPASRAEVLGLPVMTTELLDTRNEP